MYIAIPALIYFVVDVTYAQTLHLWYASDSFSKKLIPLLMGNFISSCFRLIQAQFLAHTFLSCMFGSTSTKFSTKVTISNISSQSHMYFLSTKHPCIIVQNQLTDKTYIYIHIYILFNCFISKISYNPSPFCHHSHKN